MNINLENSLGNFSFILLFIAMFIYWIQASNGMTVKKKEVVNVTTISVDKADSPFQIRMLGPLVMTLSNLSLFLLLLLRWKASGHFPLSNLYESLMFLSWSLTLIHLIIEIGFYGSFSFSSESKPGIQSYRPKGEHLSSNDGKAQIGSSPFGRAPLVSLLEPRKELLSCLIGSITAPSALFTNAFATFSLPKEMQEASPLVPALQSNWLMMHVTVMILSYAALILGSLLSIGFLVITSGLWKNNNSQNGARKTNDSFSKLVNSLENSNSANSLNPETLAFNTVGSKLSEDFTSRISVLEGNPTFPLVLSSHQPLVADGMSSLQSLVEKGEKSDKRIGDKEIALNSNGLTTPTLYKQKLAKTLDNLSYRVLGLGFPLLTIGILSGAVWANEAWGSYWSWDPKETWALLTWLVFAIYLHTRLNRGWEGKKPAIIASLGFISVWICFLGVNLIGEGLHSYGWLSNS